METNVRKCVYSMRFKERHTHSTIFRTQNINQRGISSAQISQELIIRKIQKNA